MKTIIAGLLLICIGASIHAQSPSTLPPLPSIAAGPTVVWWPVTNATGYKVYWGTQSGSYVTNWTVMGATNFTLPFRVAGTNVFSVRAFIRQPDAPGSTNTVDMLSDPSVELQGVLPAPPQRLQFDLIVEASADPDGPFREIGSVTTEVAVSEAHQFFRARFDEPQLSKVTALKALR